VEADRGKYRQVAGVFAEDLKIFVVVFKNDCDFVGAAPAGARTEYLVDIGCPFPSRFPCIVAML